MPTKSYSGGTIDISTKSKKRVRPKVEMEGIEITLPSGHKESVTKKEPEYLASDIDEILDRGSMF